MAFVSVLINKTSCYKTRCIYCIILFISILCIRHAFISFTPWFYSISSLSMKFNPVNLRNNSNNVQLEWPVDPLLLNLSFYYNKIYHHSGVAYDYHSQNELGKTQAGHQWKVWPLPSETEQSSSTDHIEISPFRTSKLPFVDAIYVISALHLTERHANIKKAFHQQGISFDQLKWRMKWNHTTCNSNLSHAYVYQRLNLKDKPLGNLICVDPILRKIDVG